MRPLRRRGGGGLMGSTKPRLPYERKVASGETLLQFCFCETYSDQRPAADVRAGRGWSCGAPKCREKK